MKREKLEELINKMLRKMYAEADPPLDWDEVQEEVKKENPKYCGEDSRWWDGHHLSMERQDAIREEVFKRKRLNRHEEFNVGMAELCWSPRFTPNVDNNTIFGVKHTQRYYL